MCDYGLIKCLTAELRKTGIHRRLFLEDGHVYFASSKKHRQRRRTNAYQKDAHGVQQKLV